MRHNNEAAFQAAVDAARKAKIERAALVKERERIQERIRERNRDRSGRQRDGAHETDSERRVRQRSESAVQSAAHMDSEQDRQAQERRDERFVLEWQLTELLCLPASSRLPNLATTHSPMAMASRTGLLMRDGHSNHHR